MLDFSIDNNGRGAIIQYMEANKNLYIPLTIHLKTQEEIILKNKFKASCALNRQDMRKVILELMQSYIDKVSGNEFNS